MLVEQQRLPPLETPVVSVSHYSINLQLKPLTKFEWQARGGFQSRSLFPGDFCLYVPDSFRKYRWHQEAEVLNIALSPAFFTQIAQEVANTDQIELLELFGGHDPQIEYLARAFLAELKTGASSGQLYAESMATALAVYLLQHYAASSIHIPSIHGKLVQSDLHRIIDYIHDHLDTDLSLSQLSEVVGMSPYHFARIFKQSVGVSPHQYIIQYRVEEAKRLLMTKTFPFREVAYRVGFGNQSHFNRHFKRLTGASPTLFLKNLHSEQEQEQSKREHEERRY
ncbi:AraC family transcriptional regulator [Dictyobacter alpinus]|uniref:AraC family transcriptional regulator n=1 Tax=Dictyobacter alpinus TaxID=2014873 RepID=A0A402BC77_9CHLR|nr:AraC family transcriptional regulator [Dictyobacter alpinus]